MVATSAFGIKIDIINIKIIIHVNESRIILNYEQKNGLARRDEKRNEIIMIRGRIVKTEKREKNKDEK